jgi:hypothetical protein
MSGKVLELARSGDHVAVFYQTPEERLELLTAYFRRGLENNEMCLYVSEDDATQVIRGFRDNGLSIRPHIASGQFRLFEMTETYLADGHFMTDYMLQNVASYIQDAKDTGYNGLRTAGEMSWLSGSPESELEAIIYENAVNLLGDGTKTFTGTCLYPLSEDTKSFVLDALNSHPVFFYDGLLRTNPVYVANHREGLIKALDATATQAPGLAEIKLRLAKAAPA